MSKPREFYIDHDEWYSKEEKEFNDRTCSKDEWNGENLVHVIEYKEFEKLNKCLNAIDDHLRKMRVDKIITMDEMIRALKVISDNLK